MNNADTEQQESQDSVMDSAKPPMPRAPRPQMNQKANARATGAAVPSHQQGPGQGRPSSTKAAASSSFFAPRQKTIAPTASLPNAHPPASSRSDDARAAHATANRREAGIAIPTNNPNPSASVPPPRTHGATNRPPLPSLQNAPSGSIPRAGVPNGLTPAASTNRKSENSITKHLRWSASIQVN